MILHGYYLGALCVEGGFMLEEIDQTNHFYCQLPHFSEAFVNIWKWQLINGDSAAE